MTSTSSRAAAVVALLPAARAAPAGAAAASSSTCPPSSTGERFAVRIAGRVRPGHETVRRLVVCDRRTGVERRSPGGRVVAAGTGGGLVAWTERRDGRLELRTSRRPDLRRATRRTLPRRATGGLAVTRTGRIALATSAGVELGGRLVVRGPVGRLSIEDGRTLRYRRTVGGVRYRDLTPLPRDGRGCPVRSRFAPVLITPEVVLSRALYGPADVPIPFVRACLRATGRDPLVAIGPDPAGFGNEVGQEVRAVAGHRIVVATVGSDRYDGCEGSSMRALDLRTGRRGRETSARSCGPDVLVPLGAPVAITAAGAVAWLDRRAGRDVLRLAADGSAAVLDEGPEGSIAGLADDGRAIVWTRDGRPQRHEA